MTYDDGSTHSELVPTDDGEGYRWVVRRELRAWPTGQLIDELLRRLARVFGWRR